MAERVQLRRTKGYRKPDGAIVVARPSVWGNPFPLDGTWIMWTAISLGFHGGPEGRRQAAVALHRAWLTGEPIKPRPCTNDGGSIEWSDGSTSSMEDHCRGIAFTAAAFVGEAPSIPGRPSLDALRGHDLACWCPLDQPCHADTLLALANAVDHGGQP